MTDRPNTDSIDDDEIDLARLFGVLFSRKFTITFVTLLGILIGVAYAMTLKPIYQADALLQLEEKSSGMALSTDLSDLFSESTTSVAEIEIIKSRMILVEVIEKLDLTISAEPKRLPVIGNFLSRFSMPEPDWSFISNYAWHGESISLGFLVVPDYLLGNPIILTSTGVETYTVTLTEGQEFEGRVGALLDVPDMGFSVFVEAMNGRSGREFILRKDRVADVVQGLRVNLSIREKGKNSSILELTLKGGNPQGIAEILNEITRVYLNQNLIRNSAEAESSLEFLREQLPEAETQVQIAEDALNEFKLSQQSIDLSFETRALLEQAVEIEAQLNALALEEQELQKRFTPSHPLYQTLLDSRTQLETRLTDLQNQSVDLPETQQEMLSLTQNLEVAQQIYLQLLNRLQELNVIKAGTVGNIRIIDTALSASKPVAPNKKTIVVLAAALGLLFAVGWVLLRSFITRGIQSAEDIEQLGIPVYTTVPKVGNGEHGRVKRKQVLPVLAKTEPTNMAVEALRSLRTSLHFGMLEAQSSLLMVTSARPGEGKSFVAVNLATVMAQAGQNICLVDVDIRRGYIRRFFGIDKKAPGLTDILAGDAQIEDVIIKDEETGLHIITAGKYPPNPSELLMHKRFGDIVRYLDDRFDLSILDTPPFLAVTDPVIVGKYTGMNLLVIRHRETNIAEIKASARIAEQNNLTITGAVLNAYDPKKSASQYGEYGMNYQYSYETRKN